MASRAHRIAETADRQFNAACELTVSLGIALLGVHERLQCCRLGCLNGNVDADVAVRGVIVVWMLAAIVGMGRIVSF